MRGGSRRVAYVDVNAGGGQLARGYADGADFALRRPGIVLERMQGKQALRSNEQGCKEQA